MVTVTSHSQCPVLPQGRPQGPPLQAPRAAHTVQPQPLHDALPPPWLTCAAHNKWLMGQGSSWTPRPCAAPQPPTLPHGPGLQHPFWAASLPTALWPQPWPKMDKTANPSLQGRPSRTVTVSSTPGTRLRHTRRLPSPPSTLGLPLPALLWYHPYYVQEVARALLVKP